ncbi:hypothetical protein [Campylobacter lari]|uniref:hypothetical protein n=1 Tax=Campylobacter lari TaxID=201 RepID=UPI00215855DC|nr:hypothetical protein [Campylobacter lari]MCR6775051.1 hypothetical protein [Campylobacter lari]
MNFILDLSFFGFVLLNTLVGLFLGGFMALRLYAFMGKDIKFRLDKIPFDKILIVIIATIILFYFIMEIENLIFYFYYLMCVLFLLSFSMLLFFKKNNKIRKDSLEETVEFFASLILSLIFLNFIFSIIFYFAFCSKPSKDFINSLKEKGIKQEIIYNHNDEPRSTLGFGICERNNYNGKTCNEYIKYIISIIKEREEEYQRDLKAKEEEKITTELNNKNKNIENIVENSFNTKDKE